jgi:hypothetical protein
MRTYLFPLLTADQIEVKVKECKKNGALLLLYKTARTDYEMLDDVLGPEGWKVAYSEIKGNLYCTLSIWSDKRGEWISKQNCGTESREDGEGNEKKGEASDAMKRAGVTLGIGRELYTSPFIFVSVPTEPKDSTHFKLADRYQTFDVREIGYDDARRINKLIIVDNKGNTVFTFPRGAQTTPQPPGPDPKPEPKPETKQEESTAGKSVVLATPFQVSTICGMLTNDERKEMVKKYGESFERLSFDGARKQIDEIKKRKGIS